VVLPGLHAGEGSSTGDQLVAEVALMLLLAVHLAVSVIGLF
jgi:hypothetical protein